MPLQNEKVLRVAWAHTPDEVDLELSKAYTDLPSALALLVSEETLRRYVMARTDLKNNAQTFEVLKAASPRRLHGRPMGFEPKAGNAFIITDLQTCIVVRYEPT